MELVLKRFVNIIILWLYLMLEKLHIISASLLVLSCLSISSKNTVLRKKHMLSYFKLDFRSLLNTLKFLSYWCRMKAVKKNQGILLLSVL